MTLLLVAVLFPVAVYLGILGWINRRPRGLLLSGPWDFAGILFAASGLLLFGGPSLLDSLMQADRWRSFWLNGRVQDALSVEDGLAAARAILFGLYFLAVVGVSVLMLRRRRRMTALYNVDPALVESVLGQTFERWQLTFVQTGNVLLIDPGFGASGKEAPPSVLIERVTTLEVEASQGMCHVTLWWDPPGSLLRREVESQLQVEMTRRPALGGTAGDWFLLAASGLFFVLVVIVGILALSRFYRF